MLKVQQQKIFAGIATRDMGEVNLVTKMTKPIIMAYQ